MFTICLLPPFLLCIRMKNGNRAWWRNANEVFLLERKKEETSQRLTEIEVEISAYYDSNFTANDSKG